MMQISPGSRARGNDAVMIGGGLGTLIIYLDCPIAPKADKQRAVPSYSNKKLPVGLPDALIFPDGLLGKTELLGIIDTIPCNAVLIVCVHRYGHSVGVTGMLPSFSTVGVYLSWLCCQARICCFSFELPFLLLLLKQ